MRARPPRAATGLALAALVWALALPGCQRRSGATEEPETGTETDPSAPASSEHQRAQASRRSAAGATCSGRDDCTSDQVCVENQCRYERTSVAGEILASAAVAQRLAGDWPGALASYESAFEAYEAEGAPIPPEVACAAALMILQSATDSEAREHGATRADLCFRTTVPGHPARREVQQAVARLRYEGLELARFDADEPADRFFTGQRTRPTVDAVEVQVQMPDLEPRELPSHTAVRERLDGEDGHRAVADCFIQDWEIRHEPRASGEIVVRFSTRLRDMGDYDVYIPGIEVESTSAGDDGFEPCLARTLSTLFDPDDRSIRGDNWSQAVRITASVQGESGAAPAAGAEAAPTEGATEGGEPAE